MPGHKHIQICKLVVYSEKDLMNLTFDEQLDIIKQAMKDRKFHIELINPPREDLKSVNGKG
tara:strand:+ start:300 stop:482 length:183 start_codon:yes stop_codon:yes gene_type:complete